MNVDDLLDELDAQLSGNGVTIGGEFYDEPRNKSKRIPGLRHASTVQNPTEEERLNAERQPGKPDTAPAPAAEEDN